MNNKQLADDFSTFFKEKIDKINSAFDRNQDPAPDQQCKTSFTAFRPVSPDEVRRYILSAPSKSSVLDSLPTELLKQCVDEVLPYITNIVNCSLQQGYLPKILKQAIVTPIPKKSNSSDFSNFRPISNLPFLSKLNERIVVDQLSDNFKIQ